MVFGGGHFGLVKHLDAHAVPRVDQGGKAHQHLARLANFHQLGQFAKVPAGVLLIAGRGPVGAACAGYGLRWRVAWPRWGPHGGLGIGGLGGLITRGQRSQGFELGQGLKRPTRLAAPFGLERTQVAAHAQLPTMLVDEPQVHEKVRAEHVQLEVRAFDIQAGFAAHPGQQSIGQGTQAKGFALAHGLRQPGRGFWQGHKTRTRFLRQAFEQGLDLVFEHARHQPFGALFADLIQHKQGHAHSDAVTRIPWCVQILGATVHATQTQGIGKGLRGDTLCAVAHQVFAAHVQKLGLCDAGFVKPLLQAAPAVDMGR